MQPREAVTRHPPADFVKQTRPGDFVLVHPHHPTARLIQFGQSVRYHGAHRPYAYWTHAALLTDRQGSIVEALVSGVQKTDLSKYDHVDYAYVRTEMSDADRDEAAGYALAMVGHEYGFASDLSLLLALPFGGRFSFGANDELICSGLVATALERGPYIWQQVAGSTMPADLAKWFDVTGPGYAGADA